MVLALNNLNTEGPTPYEVCFKSTAGIFSLTFIQSARILLLPSDTYVYLTHPTNLTFGSKGDVVLEIDECKGRSVTSVASTFNNLHDFDTEINQVKRSNNLVEFYHWGPTYIHLET